MGIDNKLSAKLIVGAALTFGKTGQDRQIAVLGLRAERGYPQSWGVLRPKARVE